MNFHEFLQAIGVTNPYGRGWLAVSFTFILAWIVTYRFIPKLLSFALKVGWADQPNARRLNHEPLPNAGGLAIYTGVIVALVLGTFLSQIGIHKVLAPVLTILLGGSILLLVGFIDDQFGLPPLFRLFVQILLSMLVIASGTLIDIKIYQPIDPIFSFLITVLWIVGVTNAVNLLDGLDGLAGGISFITTTCLLAVSAQDVQRATATLILAAVGGATLGFLRYNFHPSRIIMGDAGAYFLGFVLATTSIFGRKIMITPDQFFALVPAILFLLVPLVDTIQVFIKRLLAGKNPLSTPGKDHLHHRLMAIGLSQRHTAIILWGITFTANIVAMHLQKTPPLAIALTASGIVFTLSLTIGLRLFALKRKKMMNNK